MPPTAPFLIFASTSELTTEPVGTLPPGVSKLSCPIFSSRVIFDIRDVTYAPIVVGEFWAKESKEEVKNKVKVKIKVEVEVEVEAGACPNSDLGRRACPNSGLGRPVKFEDFIQLQVN